MFYIYSFCNFVNLLRESGICPTKELENNILFNY